MDEEKKESKKKEYKGVVGSCPQIYEYKYSVKESKAEIEKFIQRLLKEVRPVMDDPEYEHLKRNLYKKGRGYFGLYFVTHRKVGLRRTTTKKKTRQITMMPLDMQTLVLRKYDRNEIIYFTNAFLGYCEDGHDMKNSMVKKIVMDMIDDEIRIIRLRDLIRCMKDGINKDVEDQLEKVSKRWHTSSKELREISAKKISESGKEGEGGKEKHDRTEREMRDDMSGIQ